MDHRFTFRRKRPDEHESRREQRENSEVLRRGRGLAIGMSIPLTMLAGPIGGWFLGNWLDSLFGTGWIGLTLLLAGTVAGFKLAIDMLTKLNRT